MRTLLLLGGALLFVNCTMLIPQETRESQEFKDACTIARIVYSCGVECATTNADILALMEDPKVATYYRQIELSYQAALAVCPFE